MIDAKKNPRQLSKTVINPANVYNITTSHSITYDPQSSIQIGDSRPANDGLRMVVRFGEWDNWQEWQTVSHEKAQKINNMQTKMERATAYRQLLSEL